MKTCDKSFLDENTEKIADEIEKGMNRKHVFTPATMSLCPDERMGKGNYSKREIGLDKYEVVEQASDAGIDQNNINKAITKTSSDKKLNPMLKHTSNIFSDLYYDYLLFRKKIGLPKEVIEIGQLTGVHLTDMIKLINPGGLVFLKDGTYNTTAAIDMLSNVTLDGTGWGATIIDNGATNDHIIKIDTKDNVSIKNMQLNGNAGGGNTVDGIYNTGSCNSMKIINIFVNGSDNRGFRITAQDKGSVIQGCKIFGPDTAGIEYNNVVNSFLTNNYIEQAGTDGVLMSGIQMVIGNILYNSGVYGIHCENAVHSIISNNYINTTGNDGILLNGGSNDNIVTSNRIRSWTNECVDDDGANNIVKNNSCL